MRLARGWRRHAALVTLGTTLLVSTACSGATDPLAWPVLNVGKKEDFDDLPVVATPASQTNVRSVVGGDDARNQPVLVRRGQAVQTLPLVGVVASDTQTTLRFPVAGTIAEVNVRVGQAVEQGQALVKEDARDNEQQLRATQVRLDAQKGRLTELQAASVNQAQQRAEDAANRHQKAVASAQQTLERAQAALAEARRTPPTADEQRPLREPLTQAQAALAKVQAERATLTTPPEASQILQAQRDMIRAQVELDQANAALVHLTTPEPEAVASAQLDLDRARQNLQIVQGNPEASQQGIVDATRKVEDAQATLDHLKNPSPAAVDVAAARSRVQLAQIDFQSAQQKHKQLNTPATQEEINAADAAVQQAIDVLAAAQAAYDAFMANPSPSAVKAAQLRVDEAQDALNTAEQDVTATSEDSGVNLQILALQQTIEQDQAQVDHLTELIEQASIKAPFAGIVAEVPVRVGDKVTTSTAIVTVGETGTPIVRAGLTSADITRVQSGQKATVLLGPGGATTQPIPASVLSVNSGATDGTAATATLRVEWPSQQVIPRLGSTIQVTLTIRQAENVLLVPKRAVTDVNGRSFVQLVEGSSRRTVAVETGIESGNDLEVRSGLREGQAVFVPA